MKDLTIIFLTVNLVPKKWANYQKSILMEAADGAPIITMSREPLDWGTNYIQEGETSPSNIYKQVLRAAKLATTPYIGIAEDDVLYSKEHFHSFRPPLDTFAYNLSRWGIFVWGVPTYYWRDKLSNMALIAPRKLTIESLEERFAKSPDYYGELGHPKIDRRLGLESRKWVRFFTIGPIVYLQHDNGLDPLERSHRKRMGNLRAYDIPYWGKAKDVVRKFA